MRNKYLTHGWKYANELPQLHEFTATSETEDISDDLLDLVTELYDINFYVEETESSLAS